MNYKRLYDNIINNAVSCNRVKGVGLENHHIVPRCMGGDDSDDNLVYLTCREHYLVHKLIAKQYKETKWYGKLIVAVWLMSNIKGKSDVCRNSREYSSLRESFLENIRYTLNRSNRPAESIFPLAILSFNINYIKSFGENYKEGVRLNKKDKEYLMCGVRGISNKASVAYYFCKTLASLGFTKVSFTNKSKQYFKGSCYAELKRDSNGKFSYMVFTESFIEHSKSCGTPLPLHNFYKSLLKVSHNPPRIRIIKSCIMLWNRKNPFNLLSLVSNEKGVYIMTLNNWEVPFKFRHILYKYHDSYNLYKILHKEDILGIRTL